MDKLKLSPSPHRAFRYAVYLPVVSQTRPEKLTNDEH
jgi:hypothetical protein